VRRKEHEPQEARTGSQVCEWPAGTNAYSQRYTNTSRCQRNALKVVVEGGCYTLLMEVAAKYRLVWCHRRVHQSVATGRIRGICR